MGPGTIPVGQNWMCIKKIWFAGILGMLLCLLPSVAYAHDMSGFVFFPIGVMFLQIVYGIYMLFLKKKKWQDTIW